VMYQKNGVPGQYLETIGESPGDSAPTDLTSYEETTSPVELIVNVQVTLFWKKITLEKYKVAFSFSAGDSSYTDSEWTATLSDWVLHETFTVAIDPSSSGAYFLYDDPTYPEVTDATFTQSLGSYTLDDQDGDDPVFSYENVTAPTGGTEEPYGLVSASPGVSWFAFQINDYVDYYVKAEIWARDVDEGTFEFVGTGGELWCVRKTLTMYPFEDFGFPVVLANGYQSSGSGFIFGAGGWFDILYSVVVTKVP
jgi:hypothetical protein